MDVVLPSGSSVTVIHFLYPLSDASPPEYRIACMPNMQEFHQTQYHPAYQRTNEPRAVTCPACKRNDIFKRALSANKVG